MPTTVSSNGRGECPTGYPYRISRINFLVMHRNLDGVVPNSLLVSAGVDKWHNYTFTHADYFAANQPVFKEELLDDCIMNVPDWVTETDQSAKRG